MIFFFKQKTAYEMRISDWSSDVCSSDLVTWIFAVVAVVGHVFLTRLKGGWHMMAVGGSRRSAYNSGLPMSRVVASSYVISGIFAGVAAVFYAADRKSTRLNSSH